MVTKTQAAAIFTRQSAGEIANERAAAAVFEDYGAELSDNTLRRHRADLVAFAQFLASQGHTVTGDLMTTPAAWAGVTWGLVHAFRAGLLGLGYAIGTVNGRLSTVKTYARLAAAAGVLTAEDLTMIETVKGYGRKGARRVDGRRTVARIGAKKAAAVVLTTRQAAALRRQPQTPVGRRDAVILALLLDHGLRVGELAGLTVDAVDLADRTLTFYRPKVNRTQIHRLTKHSYTALRAWLSSGDAPESGPLLRGSHRSGRLTAPGMGERAITDRVRRLGLAVGAVGLSAHDCRHWWATSAARAGTDPFALQEAGGWSSLAMPRRYVAAAKIANAGVRLA